MSDQTFATTSMLTPTPAFSTLLLRTCFRCVRKRTGPLHVEQAGTNVGSLAISLHTKQSAHETTTLTLLLILNT